MKRTSEKEHRDEIGERKEMTKERKMEKERTFCQIWLDEFFIRILLLYYMLGSVRLCGMEWEDMERQRHKCSAKWNGKRLSLSLSLMSLILLSLTRNTDTPTHGQSFLPLCTTPESKISSLFPSHSMICFLSTRPYLAFLSPKHFPSVTSSYSSS